jgi:hypothetical protein
MPLPTGFWFNAFLCATFSAYLVLMNGIVFAQEKENRGEGRNKQERQQGPNSEEPKGNRKKNTTSDNKESEKVIPKPSESKTPAAMPGNVSQKNSTGSKNSSVNVSFTNQTKFDVEIYEGKALLELIKPGKSKSVTATPGGRLEVWPAGQMSKAPVIVEYSVTREPDQKCIIDSMPNEYLALLEVGKQVVLRLGAPRGEEDVEQGGNRNAKTQTPRNAKTEKPERYVLDLTRSPEKTLSRKDQQSLTKQNPRGTTARTQMQVAVAGKGGVFLDELSEAVELTSGRIGRISPTTKRFEYDGFVREATWVVRKGLAGNGISFESVANPGRYLLAYPASNDSLLIKSVERSEANGKEEMATFYASASQWDRKLINFSIQVNRQPYLVGFSRDTEANGVMIARLNPLDGSTHDFSIVKPKDFKPTPAPSQPSDAFNVWSKEDQPIQSPDLKINARPYQEGFKGGPIAGARRFLYRGFNVVNIDPLDLRNGGLSANPPPEIFDAFDQSKPYATYDLRGMTIPIEFFVPELFGPDTIAKSNSSLFFSEREMVDSFSFSVGLKVDGSSSKTKGTPGGNSQTGTVSSSTGVGYSDSQERRNKFSSSSSVSTRTKFAAYHWLAVNKQKIKLSKNLVDFILEMDLDDAGFEILFERYGTHYSLCTLIGAYCRELSYNTASETFEMLNRSQSVNADLLFVNANTQSNQSNSSTTRRENSRLEYVGYGGDAGNFDAFPGNKDPDNGVPLKVDLRPIWEIFHPELAPASCTLDAIQSRKMDIVRALAPNQLKKYLEKNTKTFDPPMKARQFKAKIKVTCDRPEDGGSDSQMFGWVHMAAQNPISKEFGWPWDKGSCETRTTPMNTKEDSGGRSVRPGDTLAEGEVLFGALDDPKTEDDAIEVGYAFEIADWDRSSSSDFVKLMDKLWVPLKHFNANQRSIEKSSSAEDSGAGKFTARLIIEEVTFSTNNEDAMAGLPAVPDMRGK